MLVLSRKEGQQIQIADGITITVVSVQGGKVRLGFTAPRNVPIQREEIRRRPGGAESALRGSQPAPA